MTTTIHSQWAMRGVPQEEIYLLGNARDAAASDLADGRVEEGYEELTYGLRRAELLRHDGIPWAEELVAGYETALREFCTRFEERARH